ncbi:MAG: SDR family oxidoreductase [Solirubrobacterales bacterium]
MLVNAVLPGDIDSAMWMGPGGVAEQVAAAEGITPEEVVAMAGELYPIGRIGKVDEVASVIVFLCSELAGNVVGVAWSVDGGYVRTAL